MRINMTKRAMTKSAMTSVRRSSRSGAPAAALCGVLAALAAGCKQTPLCTELGECGGAAPVGDWTMVPNTANFSCSEDLYTPQPDPRLRGAELPPARQPIPEPALFDWCLLLVTGPGTDVVVPGGAPKYYYESGEVGAAFVHYGPMAPRPGDGVLVGSYAVSTTRTGRFNLDFPAFCVRAFGAGDNQSADPVGDPGGDKVSVCKQIEFLLNKRQSEMGAKNFYPNILCDPHTAKEKLGGCDCYFDVVEPQVSAGSYTIEGNTILHLPGNNFPETATFCNSGGALDLTGTDGAYLFDRLGLRTLNLAPAAAPDCANGVKDLGEAGVDCGLACPMACPP